MTHFLFEQPWPVIVILGCLAAGVLASSLRRRQRGGLIVSGVLIALAVAVFVIAALVTTQREVVTALTRQLVGATAPLDAATLDRLIDPEALLSMADGSVIPMNQPLSQALQETVQHFAVKGQSLRRLNVELTDDGLYALVMLDVRTTFEREGTQAAHTQWRLRWRREGQDRWRVVDVQWLRLNNQPPPAGPAGVVWL